MRLIRSLTVLAAALVLGGVAGCGSEDDAENADSLKNANAEAEDVIEA